VIEPRGRFLGLLGVPYPTLHLEDRVGGVPKGSPHIVNIEVNTNINYVLFSILPAANKSKKGSFTYDMQQRQGGVSKDNIHKFPITTQSHPS